MTFGRAGEDNKKFKLGDIEQTLQGGLTCPSGNIHGAVCKRCLSNLVNNLHQPTPCSAADAGFAGADYDLQDALTESTDKKTATREVDGQTFYDYELSGPVTPCPVQVIAPERQ